MSSRTTVPLEEQKANKALTLQKLCNLVIYLHFDLRIPAGKNLLDTAKLSVKEQGLKVPELLIVFVCVYVSFGVFGDPRTKREIAKARTLGEV